MSYLRYPLWDYLSGDDGSAVNIGALFTPDWSANVT